jgi:O-antigen ligase/Tfp pilus assembly protein PilF
LVIVLARLARPALTPTGLAAYAGLLALLALSAASMLWAESKESAWTDVNRLALYCVLFAVVPLSVRDRRTGRVVMLALGSTALVASAWLCVSFLLGGGQGAFLDHRLTEPVGYINGTAGLLVMGMWPWLALSETAARPSLRAAALAAASLIAGTFVLTQSRAVIPASILSITLVLLCAPQRVRRAMNLLIVAGSVAVALPWTLAVYSSAGVAARSTAPGHGVLRGAGLAILVAAALAGVGRLGLSLLAERVPRDRRSRTISRLGAVLAVGAVAGIGTGVAVGEHWIARQYRAFTSLQVNENASVRFVDASGFRYDLWRIAVRELREHPAGGVGAGNYDVEYYRLRRSPQYVVQPHSLELQMAAELGIPGLLALLVFCGSVLWSGFARRETLASGDRLIKVAAVGMFTAWLAATSVDWLYDIPGIAGMAVMAAALLAVPVNRRRDRSPRLLWRRLTLAASLAVLGLIAASVGRQYVATRYAQSGMAQVARSPRTALSTLRHAAQLDPESLTTLYSLASAYARLDDYAGARATLLMAARREPHNYVPPALLGDLAMRRGYYRRAVGDYRRALALNPRDPTLAQSEHNARIAVG